LYIGSTTQKLGIFALIEALQIASHAGLGGMFVYSRVLRGSWKDRALRGV
jgi:hypothetical protein